MNQKSSVLHSELLLLQDQQHIINERYFKELTKLKAPF